MGKQYNGGITIILSTACKGKNSSLPLQPWIQALYIYMISAIPFAYRIYRISRGWEEGWWEVGREAGRRLVRGW